MQTRSVECPTGIEASHVKLSFHSCLLMLFKPYGLCFSSLGVRMYQPRRKDPPFLEKIGDGARLIPLTTPRKWKSTAITVPDRKRLFLNRLSPLFHILNSSNLVASFFTRKMLYLGQKSDMFIFAPVKVSLAYMDQKWFQLTSYSLNTMKTANITLRLMQAYVQ